MHNLNPDSDYDVFLSSKSGDNDEEPFSSHLYNSLLEAGISVFWDDDGLLSEDEQISPTVVQVIQRCRISVVVLSAGYAGSRRCLEVLEQIIEWRRNGGQFVLPVFLGIPHDGVLRQFGGFGNAFHDLTKRISDEDKVESWELSFSRICQIQSHIRVKLWKDPSSSRSVDGNKRWWSDNEVKDVVKHAKNLLDRTDLFVAEHLEGTARLAHSIPVPYFINRKPEGVLLLGIWGMVGIGKTTLAKAIYNHNRKDFEGISFLASIREVWKQDTRHVYLQERLLSDIYKSPRKKIESIEIGKKMLQEKLPHKKMLLVLDDVNKLEQLNALCGSREWFGAGSMIIITTRDRSLLREWVHRFEHEHVFNMIEMDNKASGDLISWYAKSGCHNISRNIVAYTGGLPLALEVLGSNIFKKSLNGPAIENRFKAPDPLVLKVLKSYINDLHNIEKDIFLDIACFLIGIGRVKVLETLNAFGDLVEDGISALEDNGLVTFDRGSKAARVNVLLRETGREILREQMQVKPGSWICDVFLSFKGEDTWATFTSHLYTHLANANINFFKKDDDEIRRGDRISISQLQAIGSSRVCVVVLSKHYANSRWCLQELEKIMECHRIIGQVVVPIFYGVDRSAVQNQTGEVGEAFQNLLKTIPVESDKEERWRIALGKIGNIAAGIEIPADSRNEGEDIKNVIELVTHSLDIMFVVERPVGLKARVQDVIQQLNCKKSKDVLLLGIWGMGGSGKTAIAKAIHNRIGRARKYEVRSLLLNISEDWKRDNGQLYLQEKLLSDINNGTKIKIDDVESGKELLIERLRHERILLVLDDVDTLEQLNVLCASRQRFGSDSMIIITTRDKHLLDELGVDHVYRTKEMDGSESAILFSWHAFKQPSPKEDFEGLSRDAVAYCGGLPLALVELGRELFGKDESEWDSLLGKYKRSPHPMIQNVLKSFDDLNGKEKYVLIDIALFFIGMDREEAIRRLNAFGDLDEKGISAFEDRFLVTVDMKNKLRMHVLLREEIIREQMRVEPGARIFDVFVSFKGEECATLTSHLCTCLANANINFIKDDDEIRRRDRIISLLQEIGRCRISVVVLSRDYASSRWCLQELEKIMECYKTIGQVVVPVFYGVDPSTVRNQTGQFGEAFEDVLTRFSVESDKENNWRTALQQIGSIPGTVITDSRKERDENVKNVMEHVTHSLDMFVVEHPVGLKARVQDVIQLLNCKMSKDVLLLGIWGMGGSGKTTLAKAVYNILSRKYEGRSFLQDISDIWKQDNGRVRLEDKLLSDINTTANVKKDDMKPGKRILCERLCHERLLLVLDDVDDLEQLNALCGSRECFGSDSIIIITTRDKRLLNELGVGPVYRMKEMDESESAMLLSWHAFKQPSPREDFVGLCRDVVAHCEGLPLALEVLGCELFGKDESEWKSLMHRYKRIPHPKIQNVLKRSFDCLGDDRVKNVFLDIACFFVGLDQNEVIQKLDGFGDHLAATSVPVLVEQSLVIVDEMTNRLGMNVLLQHMAREIFRERSGMQTIYDVFFSFSKDTPSSFTSCLIASLEKAGISVFRDGDHISHSRLRVIQRCRISVVVLSKGYTGSRRCLKVLEQIIECSRITGQFVLPVFFGISRYEPPHYPASGFGGAFGYGISRYEDYEPHYRKSGFGRAFGYHTEGISDKDKVESWEIALARISRGHLMSDYRTDNDEDIKKIVELAMGLLDGTDLFVAEYPVGVESRVQDACQLLIHQKDKDVLLLGIWGMAGIGKTTIAKAIYNQIGGNFEGRSFIPNIREVWKQDRRHVYLQELLLSDLCKLPIIKIGSIGIGKKILKNKLSHKRALLVLDGVNKREQLDALCGSREWFGPGSIIIITTRDKRLLIDYRVDIVHTMKEMNKSESTELFSWHVFEQPLPRPDFAELCGNVVSYCGRLPLALYVLGFKVFRKLEMEKWKNVLDGFREAPHPDIQEVLRISFNDLNDDKERDLFLDISFFYIGINKEDVVHALKGYGDSVESGITVLEDRSLVKVDENGKFGMHVLMRDMGREILRELLRTEPAPKVYDVFLSFGADMRASFTSHLYTCLQNAGCHVFKDDERLQKGDQISISMMQAIGRSRISIVVLSEKYPNSRWRMIELKKILECRKTTNQQVLPVFYGVTPSEVHSSGDPSDEKKSKFREAFEELLGNISGDKEREQGWKRALADISAIQGHVISNSWNESKDIKKVVADVTNMLVAEHPVGVESRVANVIQLLDSHQEKDILVLGIWGMGGAGKTTIAKATYYEISANFEGRSFLLDVSKVWKETNGQVSVQKKLLSDIYQEMEIKIDNIEEGKSILPERLQQKKILLVLDDVNDQEQLNALYGSRKWFGPGSIIIITTRDKRLLIDHRVDLVHTMKEMDESESTELFSWHAFKQASPRQDFADLCGNVVSYCGGLPLALCVLGSELFGEEMTKWKKILDGLREAPHRVVQKLPVLRELFRIEPGSGTYDVYLSFRGKDTHPTFSSRLHKSLENSGINVFKDHDALRGEENMSLLLLEAMRESRLFVVVFSRNYANSLLCLQELEYIIECYKTKCQVIVPVFYDVDPGEVCNQTDMFGKAFQDLLNKISVEEDKVQRWRDALREASGIPGFVVKDFSVVHILYRNIRESTEKALKVATRLIRTKFIDAHHQAGIQPRVQSFIQKLKNQQSDGVLLEGIWGMGGIGKTFFATALCDKIHCEFDGHSFLLNIREAWQREGCADLQARILFDITGEGIPGIDSGKTKLEERLRDKKVLLLLDDVNEREQLDALCGSREWFGSGSIIIITTRNKRLLTDHRVDHVHQMKEMDESESTKLFSWHAFNQASPKQDFTELCGNVVSYCGGLPLALRALGDKLFRVREEMTKWKNELDGLREGPPPDVQKVLRISFDDLNDDEQGLFLDISFFYIGINKEEVLRALRGYRGAENSGIPILEERSLVKVDENGKFGMHVLLREMGRKILRELFRINPGPMKYDVFLSFRADARPMFASHLYNYLQRARLEVFKDDESLQKGDQISISMVQAIARSRIAIVVLSERYPNSRWCMIELEKILECRRTTNQQVLPVFYGVRPSEVLSSGDPPKKRSMIREAFEKLQEILSFKKKSMFRKSFEELLKKISGDKDRELSWKRALVDISAIQGHPIAKSGNQSKDIEKIVADVTKMLKEKHRFGTFFKLRSLVHDIVKMWPFLLGLLVILVCITCRCFEKQEAGLTSFQVSQPTPNFKEAYATPTKQIEKWLDEEDTSFKRKRTISSSSQSVVKHEPGNQKVVEASTATNTFEPKSKGRSPLVQTSPIAFSSDSMSDSPEMSGNEITAQNQEDQQLQEGAEKTHETNDVSPTSLDIPADPTSTITTIIPSMDAEDDELDEDGEILAELDKTLSENYVSSPEKVESAASESEVKSLPVITIFNNIRELLDNQLEVLVADGDIKKQLSDSLAQLGRMKSQVPTNLQPLVTEIKKFHEDVVNNFPSIQEALGNHQKLIDSKNQLEEDLKTPKVKQASFSASISKGKERLNEMSKEITGLEEKLKALSEKRDKLQSALKPSETAALKINEELATLLKESEKVVSTLEASKSAFKDAESSKQIYDRKLVDLKLALGNIRP